MTINAYWQFEVVTFILAGDSPLALKAATLYLKVPTPGAISLKEVAPAGTSPT